MNGVGVVCRVGVMLLSLVVAMTSVPVQGIAWATGETSRVDVSLSPTVDADELVHWNVKLDPNGGEGEVRELDVVEGSIVSLSDAKAPVRKGYHLTGWATQPGNADVCDKDGRLVRENRFVPLKAKLYDLAYRYVSLEATEAPSTSESIETPTGWIRLMGDGIPVGGKDEQGRVVRETSLVGDVDDGKLTLYAVWDADTYTVHYDANGGSGTMADQQMTVGTKATLASCAFVREGYEFCGWQLDAGGNLADAQEVCDLSTQPGAVVVLRAQWKALPASEPAIVVVEATPDEHATDAPAPVAEAPRADEEHVGTDDGAPTAEPVGEASVHVAEGAVLLEGQAAVREDVAEKLLQTDAHLAPDEAHAAMSRAFAPPLKGVALGTPRSADGTDIESIAVRWVTSDTVDDGDAATLYVKPVGDELQTVRMQLNYALSGEHDYGAGDITITVPRYMFHDRNGNVTGRLGIPYPEEPSRNADFNWSVVGDSYVLTNTKAMSAATKGYIEFSVTGLVPHELVDMAASDAFVGTIEVVTHKGTTIGLDSNEIVARFDTEEVTDTATKRLSGEVRWVGADAIPAEQRVAGEDEYVLVTWYMYGHVTGNTAFRLDLSDTIPDEYDGFVIGATSGDGRTFDCRNVFSGWRAPSDMGYQTIKVAYPGSQFAPETDYTFHNTVTYTLTEADPAVGDDPQRVTTASASAQTTWSWHEPAFVKPTGHFMVNKVGNDGRSGTNDAPYWTHSYYSSYRTLDVNRHNTDDGYGVYPDALNEVRDGNDVEVSWTVESIGYVLPWTLAEGGDYRKIGDYGKSPVTMVTYDTDDTLAHPLYLHGGVALELGRDYEYVGVEFPRMPEIGRGRAINLQPDGSFVARHAGDGSVTYDSDHDASHIPPVTLEALVDDAWVAVATVDWSSGARAVTPASPDVVVQGGRVTLPEGTVRYRTSVSTTNAYIWYYVRPVVRLKAGGALGAAAEAGFAASSVPSVTVHNTTYMKAFDHTGAEIVDIHKDAQNRLSGYSTDVWVYPTKQGTEAASDVDYDLRQVTVHYEARVEERTVIPTLATYQQAARDGKVVPEEEGVWYDLLPRGVTPLMNTVRLRGADRVLDAYTVEDWRGTGRTMLVVRCDLAPAPEEYRSEDVRYWMDAPTIRFDATYPYDSIKEYGDELHNVIAFESLSREQIGTVENYGGEADDPHGGGNVATATAFADDAERDAMAALDEGLDGERFVYAGALTKLDYLSAARTSLDKMVQVNNDGMWSTGIYYGHPAELQRGGNARTVYEGGQYSYLLRMVSNADTKSKDLVLYDSLENFHAGAGHDELDVDAPSWHGEFVGVDVRYLRELGVEPVVWYSTVDNLVLADETDPNKGEDANLELKAPVWVRASEYTGALSDVRAVAIDCSRMDAAHGGGDFVLGPLESVVVTINMRAPSGDAARAYIANDAHAYNNAFLTCTSIDVRTGDEDSDNFVRKDYTKVGLKEHSLAVEKVWDDGGNRDGIRPSSVTVRLFGNGVATGDVLTLDANGDWRGSFAHIPYTNANGVKIHYTVKEDAVPGYVAWQTISDDRVRISNEHVPECISVSGTKTWEGDDEGVRPSSVRVNLLANGVRTRSAVVTAGADGTWSYVFEGVWRNEDGTPITYTVTDSVEDYVTSAREPVVGLDGDVTADLVNTYHPFGDISITKHVMGATEHFRDRRFPLRLDLRDIAGDPLEGAYAWETSDGRSGEIATGGSVEIGDGETAWVRELPKGCRYAWVEDAPAGYAVSASTGLVGTVRTNATTDASITNTYAAEGLAQLGAHKTLAGRAMTRSQFRFQILDGDGAAVRTAANQADGTVAFGALSYTEADAGKTYTYRLVEVDRGRSGYTYDGGAYLAHVSVSDNGDGTLSTVVSYQRVVAPSQAGEPETYRDVGADEVSFANVYAATGSVKLRAWKRLSGGTLADGQFSFELVDADGHVIQTKRNDADGNVRFDEISYTEADAGKTFNYAVREVAGDDPTIVYDGHAYGYAVRVTDNGDGTLATSVADVAVTEAYRRVAWADVAESDRSGHVWCVDGTNILVTNAYPDLERDGSVLGLSHADVDTSGVTSANEKAPLVEWSLSGGTYALASWRRQASDWCRYFCGTDDYAAADKDGMPSVSASWSRGDASSVEEFTYPLAASGVAKLSAMGLPARRELARAYEGVPDAYVTFMPYARVKRDVEAGRGVVSSMYGNHEASDLYALVPVYEFGEASRAPAVFENAYKSGAVAIEKVVTSDTPAAQTDKEFTYHVRLVGDGLPESLTYRYEKLDSAYEGGGH